MMRDAMEHAGLAIFPQIGVVLFLFGFALALANVFIFMRGAREQEMANMPLDD
jgi:uncharacterized membrane protein YozB (DUF420 family)